MPEPARRHYRDRMMRPARAPKQYEVRRDGKVILVVDEDDQRLGWARRKKGLEVVEAGTRP